MINSIKDFYLNVRIGNYPILDDVLNGDHEFIECCHNWCQRAFPNYEPSEIVLGAPVLDDNSLEFIRRTCKEKVNALVFKYLKHYTELLPSEMPHNNRRVTRLLKFLVILGYSDMAIVVYEFCTLVHTEHINTFHDNVPVDLNLYQQTIEYWNNALKYKKEKL